MPKDNWDITATDQKRRHTPRAPLPANAVVRQESEDSHLKPVDLARGFSSSGCCIARSLFKAEEVEEIKSVFQQLADLGPIANLQDLARLDPDETLARYPRMLHPHRFRDLPVGPLAMKYMLDRRIEIILRALMGEEPLAVQSMFYFKPACARGQALHQDNYYLRIRPATCVAAWTAIDDADIENGCLVVVPGSHTMEIICPEPADRSLSFTTEYVPIPEGLQEEPVTLAAGDVLFFNGSLIHGSYPNRSRDRFRRAFICHYIPMSSTEAAAMYKPILRFNGEEAGHVAEAVGGGPCGVEWGVPASSTDSIRPVRANPTD